jgi:hypothetical protein
MYPKVKKVIYDNGSQPPAILRVAKPPNSVRTAIIDKGTQRRNNQKGWIKNTDTRESALVPFFLFTLNIGNKIVWIPLEKRTYEFSIY